MPPYAGLSAFYRKDAPEDERNARMEAIGILVPSTGRYGRLGRAWNHAAQLKALAQYSLSYLIDFRTYADNPDDTSNLELYFDTHYNPEIPMSAYPVTPNSPPTRYPPMHLHPRDRTITRKRSVSDTAGPFRGLKLSVCRLEELI